MNEADLKFIHGEDTWICMTRQAHELFCDCSNWKAHIKKLLDLEDPGWQDQPTGLTENGGTADGGRGNEVTDEDLIAAAEAVEHGEDVENNLRSDF